MYWESILRALWLFLPAYAANMSPVFMAKIVPWWSAPIDGGRMHKDGRRVLGGGKTWRGLVGGAFVGAWTAVIVAWLARPALPGEGGFLGLFSGWDYGLHGYAPGGPVGWPPELLVACSRSPELPACGQLVFSSLWQVAAFGGVVGAMALVGDAVKSYFKRRRGKEGGAPWFPFDQLDFVVFGLLGMLATGWLLAPGWLWTALTDDWLILTTLIVLTPLLHFLVNVMGYFLKLKKVPW